MYDLDRFLVKIYYNSSMFFLAHQIENSDVLTWVRNFTSPSDLTRGPRFVT